MVICFAITFLMWYPFLKVADKREYELEQITAAQKLENE